MDFNPWQVENIEVFNYYCCPECVYRAKEEFDFQVHAIQNHVQSRTLFNHENVQSRTLFNHEHVQSRTLFNHEHQQPKVPFIYYVLVSIL